jgi:hypothetical protein
MPLINEWSERNMSDYVKIDIHPIRHRQLRMVAKHFNDSAAATLERLIADELERLQIADILGYEDDPDGFSITPWTIGKDRAVCIAQEGRMVMLTTSEAREVASCLDKARFKGFKKWTLPATERASIRIDIFRRGRGGIFMAVNGNEIRLSTSLALSVVKMLLKTIDEAIKLPDGEQPTT